MSVEIAVGVALDVYDPDYKCWCIADIINVNQIKFECHMYGNWQDADNVWINKQNTELYAPLHLHTINCNRLKIPPILGYNCGRPIYYKNSIIITSDNDDYVTADPFVYKYDILKNEYIKISEYP
eukprot:379349_1